MRLRDLYEAKYVGNIGMVEMFKFYEVASPEEKQHMRQLILAHKEAEAWAYLQRVTGMALA